MRLFLAKILAAIGGCFLYVSALLTPEPSLDFFVSYGNSLSKVTDE